MSGWFTTALYAQDSTAVDSSTAFTASDSLAVAKGDTLPEGMNFIYRAPVMPMSIEPAVDPGKMYYIELAKEQFETRWDSANTYTVQRKIGDIDVGVPSVYSFEEFAAHQKEQQIKEIQRSLIEEGMESQA